jgi:hypothetical protein
MEIQELTEGIKNTTKSDEGAGYMSIMLFSFAVITKSLTYLIDNYDDIFKVLSIFSLILVTLVNAGKLTEQIIASFNKVKTALKKKK